MSGSVFRSSYRVVWVDTDAAQVVHYANFFRFFERTEEEFYRHLGFSFTEMSKRGLWFPRVEAFCQYKKPARFNDLLQIELTVADLKEKSVKYEFRVFNEESSALLAIGHIVVVTVDKQTGKATEIPVEIVEMLRPFCK
jgi:acyl-CoA thioester hydrolase